MKIEKGGWFLGCCAMPWMRCGAVRCGAVRCGAVWCGVVSWKERGIALIAI